MGVDSLILDITARPAPFRSKPFHQRWLALWTLTLDSLGFEACYGTKGAHICFRGSHLGKLNLNLTFYCSETLKGHPDESCVIRCTTKNALNKYDTRYHRGGGIFWLKHFRS